MSSVFDVIFGSSIKIFMCLEITICLSPKRFSSRSTASTYDEFVSGSPDIVYAAMPKSDCFKYCSLSTFANGVLVNA